MLIEKLQKHSSIPRDHLLHFAATASRRYKSFSVPKKNGKEREIHQPSRALKEIQRWMVGELIHGLPVHKAATAYKKGTSIKFNSIVHKNTNFTLRLDFENFFHSFSTENVYDFLEGCCKEGLIDLNSSDLKFVSDIVTRYGHLTIGAPSSPHITNAMMFEFDSKVSGFAVENSLVYSRYADDVFISSRLPYKLDESQRFIERISKEFRFAHLALNHQKSTYLSKKYKRSITGLVITPTGNISIGRHQKRKIKALIHRFVLERLTDEEIGKVRGLLAFVNDVEPRFLSSLVRKYGEDVLGKLLR